jgi:high-affinity iron transporter
LTDRTAPNVESPPPAPRSSLLLRIGVALAIAVVVGVLAWQAATSAGAPDPLTAGHGSTAAAVDIAVLVFREGLESILVLAAITASLVGSSSHYRRPIGTGVLLGMAATVITWIIAVSVLESLADNVTALHLQVITGLLAIVVLLVVMNWFFHKVYWSGWISMHTKRKGALFRETATGHRSEHRLVAGLIALGFTSFYREGFEVVLFLQSYRLRLGSTTVFRGVVYGLALTAIVAAVTFVANHRLPYKRMLVITGVLLGGVLLVMVGEQAQEMQFAGWLPTTPVRALARLVRPWMGTWFAVFPTVETLGAQGLAALVVGGSYLFVQYRLRRLARRPVVPTQT